MMKIQLDKYQSEFDDKFAYFKIIAGKTSKFVLRAGTNKQLSIFYRFLLKKKNLGVNYFIGNSG